VQIGLPLITSGMCAARFTGAMHGKSPLFLVFDPNGGPASRRRLENIGNDGDMETLPTLAQLTEEIRDLGLQVSTALDRVEERDLVSATHASVERVSQNYRAFFATLSEGEKLQIDRTLGRRLADAKRLASTLPKVGLVETSTPDRRVSGASEVGERRITGVSWGAGSRPVSSSPNKLKVGGDVEAWCSPCGELKEHSIVAMVGDVPKQVVCQSCNSRHTYRTTPARKTSTDVVAGTDDRIGSTGASREAARRGDEKAAAQRALANEVAVATDVRPFDPKGRYKAGEIILHPDHGRGKIENVLRSSLLVRFGVGGLKSVMLN
jgi:hypothetical protein